MHDNNDSVRGRKIISHGFEDLNCTVMVNNNLDNAIGHSPTFQQVTTMTSEDRSLKTLDEIPPTSGFTAQEIQQTLEENKLVEQHVIWAEYLGDQLTNQKSTANVDILLPNGILVPTVVPLQWTLKQLKQNVYKYMKKLPLGTVVKDANDYYFVSVGDDGQLMTLYDEERAVNAIQMFLPVLALKEPDDNNEEKRLNKNIDLEKRLPDELKNFRLELFNACLRAEQERGTDGVLHYAFPEETVLPNVGDRCFSPNSHSEVHEEDVEFWWYPNLPGDAQAQAMQCLKKKVERSKNGIEVWYSKPGSGNFQESVGIKDIFDKTPSDIIKMSLNELRKTEERPGDFILQVAGKRVFITRNLNIIRFEYIRSGFENYRPTILLLRRKREVFVDYPSPPPLFEPFYIRAERFRKAHPYTKKSEPRCFWDLDDNMTIKVKSVSNMEVGDIKRVYIRIAVAVGRHVLDVQDSIPVPATIPRWSNEENTVHFSIYLKDLPESAQMSFSLISVGSEKSGSEEKAIGYVNIRLFDWRNCYVQGTHTLYLWPFPKENDTFLNLLGVQGQNYNSKTIRLEVDIPECDSRDAEFPDWSLIERFAEFNERLNITESKSVIEVDRITRDSPVFNRLLRLRMVLNGSQLTEDDQKFLWNARYKIQELFPQMVLILADCPLIYRERETLCEFYSLLNDWPQLYVDTAMELLDVRFPDRYVRAFAVRHLDKCLDNDQLQLYLLPLVQVLRYEPFATSPLADMLVRRALMDYRIGHTFFWLLCSELALFKADEMKDLDRAPQMYGRFCLMFEAYCRGNSTHLDSMLKQKDMVNKLTTLSEKIKSYAVKEMAGKWLKTKLVEIKELAQWMASPLNPCYRLGELLIDECRVLGSAKMPLKLRWTNPEPLAHLTNPIHEIIFKNGDDLRQDMLTLQVMRIMDAKWKNYNLDYCLTLYEVLPMGQNIGMIHVVQNCHTIFQIQCASKQIGSTISMDQQLLNKYIYDMCSKDKALNSKQYMESVDRFSSSLAGYCIATYVLGIKDRHQDNLMLVDDGRLFHIDYGHVLGHSKRKLGINRERTEFVLTDHFLCVISHGKDDIKGTYMYKNFRESCLQGYMLLHYHRRFFIALFRMMRCMGLPELTKDEDVDYLMTSLMFDKMNRTSVESSFLEIFDNVVKSDLSTNINWFFHSVRHHK